MCEGYGEILEMLAARPSGKGWDGCCPLAYRHRHGDANPSLRLFIGTRGELVAECYGCGARWPEIVAATGTTPACWWPEPLCQDPQSRRERRLRWSMSKVVAVYKYEDAEGYCYAQKLRREPGPHGEAKHFSWRRPLPPSLREKHGVGPGEEAWAWGLEHDYYRPHEGDPRDWRQCRCRTDRETGLLVPPEGGGACELPYLPPGLFRLRQLIENPPESPVVIVEGEKKANALFALGLCAVSGPAGARVWDHTWGDHFAGRKVVVIPDNNHVGLAHAVNVAGSLLLGGAGAVKLIRPGELWPVAEGKDVYDWLARIHPTKQRQELAALFRRFPAYAAVLPVAAPQAGAA